MNDDAAPEQPDRISALIAAAIATAVVLSAVIAWRATVENGRAGGSASAAISAALQDTRASVLSRSQALEHQGAFLSYRRHLDTATLLTHQADSLPADDPARSELMRQATESRNLAEALSTVFFNDRYFDPVAGTYDYQREQDELKADAVGLQSVDSQASLETAAKQRDSARKLVGVVILTAMAVLLLTSAEGISRAQLRRGLVMLGIGLIATSVGLATWLELASRRIAG